MAGGHLSKAKNLPAGGALRAWGLDSAQKVKPVPRPEARVLTTLLRIQLPPVGISCGQGGAILGLSRFSCSLASCDTGDTGGSSDAVLVWVHH